MIIEQERHFVTRKYTGRWLVTRPSGKPVGSAPSYKGAKDIADWAIMSDKKNGTPA